ncbi:NUDIX hydrolase [Streptomyces sp. NPDC059832]|uniref:NUDIX hydrolase n=1 Tax=Streptomyces sp. NPDC059832 TaxID=3346966 RepID=UPI003656015D
MGLRNTGLRKRWTSRVLLIDEHDRLLLLCGRAPGRDGARWWFTVGGGVEDGEDYVRAAIREVREETAPDLPADRLGPVVWTRQTLFSVDGQGFDQYEEYRTAHVTAAEVAVMRVETDEARYGRRWWTVQQEPGPPPPHPGDFDLDKDKDGAGPGGCRDSHRTRQVSRRSGPGSGSA